MVEDRQTVVETHVAIRQFEIIYQLVKEKGYTLAGAKKFLKEEKEQMRKREEAVKSLKKLRGFLEELKGVIRY